MAVGTIVTHVRTSGPAKRFVMIGRLMAVVLPIVLWFAPLPLARPAHEAIAIASSLTELFAPDLMATRLVAFEKYYTWIDPAGLDYFRRRVAQAKRDSDEALGLTLEYCNTPELQRAAESALEFKCDVLWSLLEAIHHAYPIRDS